MIFKKFKLDFIVIGAQKAGTTALYKYLKQHSKISLSEEKELHFFDNEVIFKKKEVSYFNLHKHFKKSFKNKVYGEITPIYIYWKHSIERIHKYNPKIKLIAILRNPIDRAFSHWNMETLRGIEKEDFFECIKLEVENRNNNNITQDRIRSYVERGIYSEQIERILQHFPKEQILFIKYDDFFNDQEITINKIFDFLSVDLTLFKYQKKVIHKLSYERKITKIEEDFLSDFFSPEIEKVENLLGWDCSNWKKNTTK